MRKEEIIIYIPNFSGGGTERFFTQFALSLSKLKKYQITYFYSVDLENTNFSKKPYINFKKTKSKRATLAFFEILFLSWIKRYSLIITAQNNPNVLFSYFRFLLPKRIKLIISEQTATDLALKDSKLITSKFINKLISFSYKNADYVHCITDRSAALLIDKYKVPKEKTIVIPYYVDFSLIDKNSKLKFFCENFDKNFLESKFIVSMGRLHSQKGYQFLIDAFSTIAHKIPHNLVIIGDGSQMHILKKQVKTFSLENRVLFTGYLKNPYPIIKKADLFVISSLYEGLSLALIEAISLGIPILSSDCPFGPREILGEEYEDLLYQPLNSLALSKLIIQQLKNPKKIPTDHIKERFSIQNVMKAFEELIDNCLIKRS